MEQHPASKSLAVTRTSFPPTIPLAQLQLLVLRFSNEQAGMQLGTSFAVASAWIAALTDIYMDSPLIQSSFSNKAPFH